MNDREKKDVVESIALAEEIILDICARIAEDHQNHDWIGGSTGNAIGTAKRIAAAIRALKKITRN